MNERLVYLAVIAALLVALALCGYLFLTVKRELQRVDRRRARQNEELSAGLNVLKDRLQDLAIEFDSAPALPPATGMNVNKRAQALRMVKRGDGPERIAAVLSLSTREVELLVKVQKLICGA